MVIEESIMVRFRSLLIVYNGLAKGIMDEDKIIDENTPQENREDYDYDNKI